MVKREVNLQSVADPPPAEVYERDGFEPKASIGHLVGRLRGEMLSVVDAEFAADQQLASLEVTGSQYIIIAALAASNQARSASDLCKGISYDAGAMTRMIDRLEAKGLIHRERCSEDRRLVYLELTEQGRAAFPRMREISRAVHNRFLAGFTKAEARQLESLLRRMLENA